MMVTTDSMLIDSRGSVSNNVKTITLLERSYY